MAVAKLISCRCRIKRPDQFKNNIISIYSPKKVIINVAYTGTIDTELILKLPSESKSFLATKFTGQKLKEITEPKKKKALDNST